MRHLKIFSLLLAAAALQAQTIVNFENQSGYTPASSFIIPGEPGAVDGWTVLSGQLPDGKLIFGGNGARITPDPIIPLLGGSQTLTVLQGLQSAAVTTNGALLGRKFNGNPAVSGNMRLSYRVITSTSLLGLGGPVRVAAEFRYSDNLVSNPASFPAGARLSTLTPNSSETTGTVEVLTSNQTWLNTGVSFIYNHAYIVEIDINAATNQYAVTLVDVTEPAEPRIPVGTFTANGILSQNADQIRAQGGIALASQGGTVIFDDVQAAAR